MRSAPGAWLTLLRTYVAASFAIHLAWEILQLRLYAIWEQGTPAELVWAVLHCTVGDVLIALAALVSALVLFGDPRWPQSGLLKAAAPALVFGLGYTVYSEWLNASVRGAWAYTEAMPLLTPLGVGLAPMLQWMVVPPLALWLVHRRIPRAN